jgi:hypothetical protein
MHPTELFITALLLALFIESFFVWLRPDMRVFWLLNPQREEQEEGKVKVTGKEGEENAEPAPGVSDGHDGRRAKLRTGLVNRFRALAQHAGFSDVNSDKEK